MSVILQTIIHNPFIRNFYLSEGHKTADCEKESCVSCALDEMFVEFHSAEKTEGFGAVSMLMGSWLAGEVSVEADVADQDMLIRLSRHSRDTSSRMPTNTCSLC